MFSQRLSRANFAIGFFLQFFIFIVGFFGLIFPMVIVQQEVRAKAQAAQAQAEAQYQQQMQIINENSIQ